MIKKCIVFCAIGLFSFTASADFNQWKENFAKKALRAGVSDELVQQFIILAQPRERVVKSEKTQAEFKKTIWEYLNSAVSDKRIANGMNNFATNKALLEEISSQTGVAPQIITAIWGVETNYGSFTGNIPLIQALSTLAYRGRRSAFFEKELLALLQLIQIGDVPDVNVTGSWAGGMGMTQFIPTTYMHYGVDYDGDGQKNLWQLHDALGSTGSYLEEMGWQVGQSWGREVQLPQGFNYLLTNDRKLKKTVAEWSALGVRDAFGNTISENDDNIMARLFVPAGQYGPKFLLYTNFDVIKRYNNSDAYALAVSLLSERIAGSKGLVAQWPANDKKMTRDDIKLLQSALNNKTASSIKVDGVLGNGTRRAIQQYQVNNGLVPDGFLTNELFNQLVFGENFDVQPADAQPLDIQLLNLQPLDINQPLDFSEIK